MEVEEEEYQAQQNQEEQESSETQGPSISGALSIVKTLLSDPTFLMTVTQEQKKLRFKSHQSQDSRSQNPNTTALEGALRRIENKGRDTGFSAGEIDSVAELACRLSEDTGMLCKRVFIAAVPNSTVNAITVIKVMGYVNGIPLKCKLVALEWILAVWDAIADKSKLRLLYFAFFHLINYESLMIKLFNRNGSVWIAALLYQYKKLSPDSFVLPFDPHAIIGTDKKIADMLSISNMSNKRHYAWRELVAKKRRGERGTELPAYQDMDDDDNNEGGSEQGSIDDGRAMAADDSEGKVITESGVNTLSDLETSFNEVTPSMTYLVSTGGLPTFSAIRDGDDIVRILGAGRAAFPLIPDKLACILRSKAQMHFVSVAFPGSPSLAQHLERLDSWAGFCIERHFGTKNLNGYNTLRNIVRMGVIFREVPPAVVSGLATLLSATKNSQREAAMLLKWIPSYAWVGHVKKIYNFVVPMLIGPPENAFYGMYAVESAIRKLTASCTVELSASAFFGTLPSRYSVEDRKQVVAELCKYSFIAGKKLSKKNVQLPLVTLEALLSLVEAVAAAAAALPDIDFGESFPTVVFERLFAVPSAMFVSRTLGALALFGKNSRLADRNKDFSALVGKIRRALADPEGEFSLVTHPGLRYLAKNFAEKVRAQAAKSGSGRVDTSLGNIIKRYKPSLIRFYANHSIDGIREFVDAWPFVDIEDEMMTRKKKR